MVRSLPFAVLAALLVACFAAGPETGETASLLRVRSAPFSDEIVLSGELEAARGELLTVPPIPSWQTAVKWIAEDGTAVKAGDPVAELDNSALTADLEAKRQGAAQALQELQQREAEWSADLEDKQLDLEKKRYALEKAAIDAAVPADLLSKRAWEEKQSALRRARVEHEKSADTLAARRTAIDAERRNLLLNIERTRRAIALAEEAIAALVLRAPRDGIVVVRDHQWEGRKLQAGDPVWVGFPIALLPDLDSLRVTAALADVDDGKIARGMPVTVTLDGYPDSRFTGRIDSISAVAQESRRASLRRNFEVRVALDQLDVKRMRPGLSARVVVTRQKLARSLLVPRAALDFSAPRPRARMDGGDLREVDLGPCNALDCVVTKGLEEGDRLEPVVEARGG